MGGRFGPRGQGNMLMRALDRLDLSDEQQEALKALLEDNRESVEANREQLHEARTALREAMQAETVDLNAVRTLADKVGAVETEAAVFRASMKNQIMEILTEEQRAELQEMIQNRKERRAQMRSQGNRGPRGRRGGMRRR